MSQLQTATAGGESFAALFEESLQKRDMRSGEVISAEVVRIDHSFVVVNAGLKSEAYVPIEEFKNDQGEVEVQVGDFVSVAIDALENGYGDTILSRDKAKRLASWLSLETALESGDATLEEALALWEQGEQYAQICETWLAGAQERLSQQEPSPSESAPPSD